MIVSGADLLANDEFGGFSGRDLGLILESDLYSVAMNQNSRNTRRVA
jgi:hypothetical protein